MEGMLSLNILFWLLAACLFWVIILIPCGAVFIWRARQRAERDFEERAKGIEERIKQRGVWFK